MGIATQILGLIASLSFLIITHELGHFTFAKIFKTRVDQFYLFFNPGFSIVRMKKFDGKMHFSFFSGRAPKEWAEHPENTEWGLGWLPLGGFCAINGMVDETTKASDLSEEVHEWEFRAKPAWQRLLIMIGGVLVNFLLALFIYSMILFYWGDTYVPAGDINMKFNDEAKSYGFHDGDILVAADGKLFKDFSADLYRMLSEAHDVEIVRNGKHEHVTLPGDLNLLNMLKSEPRFVEPLIPAEVDSVMPGTPAASIGLESGSKILAINGRNIDSYNTFRYEVGRLEDLLAVAKNHEDSLKVRTVTLTFKGTQRDTTKQVVLTEELKLGFMPRQLTSLYKPYTREYGFFESIPAGVKYGWNVLAGYVADMKYVFTAEGAKSLGGFGTIGSLFPPMWDWYMFWKMTAFLSIILAFMNILPIPALDGGHVLFLLYEIITRRKPSEQFMIRAEYVGFGILILLMVVANLNDILRWVGFMQ